MLEDYTGREAWRDKLRTDMAKRAFICAALSSGVSDVFDPGCEHSLFTLQRGLSILGLASYRENNAGVNITGGLAELIKAPVSCAGCPEAFFFLMPVAAALGLKASFTSYDGLPRQSISSLITCLNSGGMTFAKEAGCIYLGGRLQSDHYHLNEDELGLSLSGLMLALPLLNGESVIDFAETAYNCRAVSMTKVVQKNFGVSIIQQGRQRFFIKSQIYKATAFDLEGDWPEKVRQQIQKG